jgi:hypothetical protein
VRFFAAKPLLPPDQVQQIQVPPETPPIPHLAIYHDGICCRMCKERPYICRNTRNMSEHLNKAHSWRGKGGRPLKNPTASTLHTVFVDVTVSPITCQTFHRSNFFRFFQVNPDKTLVARNGQEKEVGLSQQLSHGIHTLSIPKQIELQLDQKLAALDRAAAGCPGQRHFSQVSPWLDTTQWARYLQGHNLLQAASLIELPGSVAVPQAALRRQGSQAEHYLLLLLESFDRVIEQARNSLLEDKVNVFDQHRVNSFIPRRSSSRPLWYKLKEPTYRTYKKVWKQLLCFLYRMVWQKLAPVLHCCLSSTQSTALEAVLRAAASLAQQQESVESDIKQYREIDRACLLLCIALLDHPLHGNIYDSVVVGFLAVLGINSHGSYHEATTYTPSLSAFVKLSQLLVVQRAVLAVEEDEVDHAADILDVMQDRFMVYGTRSPMNWALKLRAYGKKIQDTTTGLGHIIWSDDGEELKYKGLEMTMTTFRRFVSHQVEIAQSQLHELLLVNPEENREDVVPTLALRDLKDDPTVSEAGWSFLKDSRNVALQGYDRWLLNRVANNDWLQEEFFAKSKTGKTAKWSRTAAEHYLQQVDAFLHRLLLMVHITAGQPSRGTELLSLQYCNTAHGLRRNIFVENGLVSFVTFYHKGYSIQGSTKIIHRYLPKEISELVVYYLWLVRPFANQLRMLALDQTATIASPFLWAQLDKTQNEKGQYSPWPSSRLSHILKQEFKIRLNTEANIQIWRHTAIAISRRHLKQAKFNKDYDIGTGMTWNDAQACHLADLAGCIYARGIEEAPGHVASARAEYRQVSRAWHSWLGFALYLGGRASSQDLETSSKRKALSEISQNKMTYKRVCNLLDN